MAKYGIDFKRVDSAFQQLANTPKGAEALDQLQKAHEAIKMAVKPQLNEFELHYLLTNLTQQRAGAHGSEIAGKRSLGVKIKSGFVIKTAVPAS